MEHKAYIIAEIGVNHNGSVKLAKRLIDAAVIAGADAVKFQTFSAQSLATPNASKALYQMEKSDNGESQRQMLEKLQLDGAAHSELFLYCKRKKIVFLSSAFDLESLKLLQRLKLTFIKIPSGEITDLPYLRKAGSFGKRIIISSGMSDLKEVKTALKTLIAAGTPRNKITVLQCHTAYPTHFSDVHLRAMLTIAKECRVRTGLSDHTPGIEVPIAAVALGASVIEKHLTLDRGFPGPDHRASLEPDEFKAMVSAIRNIEKSLGSVFKKPTANELKNRAAARKSIVASRDIRKGERFSEENLSVKRPGTGVSPMLWDEVLKRKAKRNFFKDDLIEL